MQRRPHLGRDRRQRRNARRVCRRLGVHRTSLRDRLEQRRNGEAGGGGRLATASLASSALATASLASSALAAASLAAAALIAATLAPLAALITAQV